MLPDIRQANDGYADDLREFERLLREGSPCRLEDEYPLAFTPSNADRLFLIREGGEFQAGLVSLERELEIVRGEVARTLFVGSVVTDPRFRNKGLQRRLFEHLYDFARGNQIDLIVLWSNQLDFYQKLGFFLGGLQASWLPSHQGPMAPSKIPVQVTPSRTLTLSREHFAAFDQKICRVKRSFDEMERLWRIPQMTIAHTERAYALMGKGEDFEGVCHEWAGPADEVLACFDSLRALNPKVRILSPGVVHLPDEMRVTQALEAASFDCNLEYLGLFRLTSDRLRAQDLLPEDLAYPFFIWGLDSI